MSEEQLSALLGKLKEDAVLRDQLTASTDLDAAVALAKQAGFDVSKADWLEHQASQAMELSDEELAGVAGGGASDIEAYKKMQEERFNKMKEALE
jgi:predicted ribosomally synthesized peptide with nif11-like leader